MYKLLENGISDGLVVSADTAKKISIGGRTSSYEVYRIDLKKLFYNDKNDRIATWVSKYKSETGLSEMDMSDIEAYNDIVQGFIIQSDQKALEKTKDNIRALNQREPGIVLNDGRIIDGNRRFTCLRMLAKENPDFRFFEAVILDSEINAKTIKLLELQIQHGEETKVDYNPIDKMVGLYQTVVVEKMLTLEEYRVSCDENLADVKRRMAKAELMVDFLEFINAPHQYYIARDFELDGPLQEAITVLGKCETDEEKEEFKTSIFTNILMKTKPDVGKGFIRHLKKIISSEFSQEFIEEQLEIAEEVLGITDDVTTVDSSFINHNIRSRSDIRRRLADSFENALDRAQITEILEQPALQLTKALKYIRDVDTKIVGEKLSRDDQDIIINLIEEINSELEIIKNCAD